MGSSRKMLQTARTAWNTTSALRTAFGGEKQDRASTYDVTLRCVLATILAVEKK
jgi:hypothetical protein